MNHKMSEPTMISSTVWGIIITGLLGIVSTVLGIFASRQKERADSKKTGAEAASILTGAALEMVEKIQHDFYEVKSRVRELERKDIESASKIASLEYKVEVRDEIIDGIIDWMANNEIVLQEAGISAPQIPNLRFRGGDIE